MIQATIRKNSVEITGHAMYAEHGKDIVCSAVSILFQVCAYDFSEHYSSYAHVDEDRKIVGLYTADKDFIDIHTRTHQYATLNFLKRGLHMIAREYPEHVKVEVINE